MERQRGGLVKQSKVIDYKQSQDILLPNNCEFEKQLNTIISKQLNFNHNRDYEPFPFAGLNKKLISLAPETNSIKIASPSFQQKSQACLSRGPENSYTKDKQTGSQTIQASDISSTPMENHSFSSFESNSSGFPIKSKNFHKELLDLIEEQLEIIPKHSSTSAETFEKSIEFTLKKHNLYRARPNK